MAGLPARADVVVIGAGIVGNSLAYHLARLGWRNIVLVDKGTSGLDVFHQAGVLGELLGDPVECIFDE